MQYRTEQNWCWSFLAAKNHHCANGRGGEIKGREIFTTHRSVMLHSHCRRCRRDMTRSVSSAFCSQCDINRSKGKYLCAIDKCLLFAALLFWLIIWFLPDLADSIYAARRDDTQQFCRVRCAFQFNRWQHCPIALASCENDCEQYAANYRWFIRLPFPEDEITDCTWFDYLCRTCR